MDDDDPAAGIKVLARHCANKGLNLRNARMLFEAMYMAECLALTGNHVTNSAKIAGINREGFSRKRTKAETDVRQWSGEADGEDQD